MALTRLSALTRELPTARTRRNVAPLTSKPQECDQASPHLINHAIRLAWLPESVMCGIMWLLHVDNLMVCIGCIQVTELDYHKL